MYTVLIINILVVAAIYHFDKQKQLERLLQAMGVLVMAFYATTMISAPVKTPTLIAAVVVVVFNFNIGAWTLPVVVSLFAFILGVL